MAGPVGRQLADGWRRRWTAWRRRSAARWIAPHRDDEHAPRISAEERRALQRECAADRVRQSHDRAERRLVVDHHDADRGPAVPDVAVRDQLTFQEDPRRFRVESHALLRIMSSHRSLCALLVAFVLAAPAAARAQANADVQAGKTLFSGLCVTCHGFDGTGGMGPPLNRPKLLLAPDEAALRNIISEGIPDRGMPRVRRVTDNEMRQLVAYVRSLGRTARPPVTGNAQKGREHYTRLGCAGCHIINGQGGSLGPSLNEIGRLRGADYLRQALVDPGAQLPKGTLPVP